MSLLSQMVSQGVMARLWLRMLSWQQLQMLMQALSHPSAAAACADELGSVYAALGLVVELQTGF